jgi:hypothetical protein
VQLTEALSELGIEFREAGAHHHVSTGWVGVDCPSCSPGTGGFRLGINLRSLGVNCWSCGPLRLADSLARSSGGRLGDVLRLLSGVERLHTPRKQHSGRFAWPEGTGPLTQPHRAYLRRRKGDPPLDAELLQRLWGLKSCRTPGRTYEHVIIPIIQDGECISWTARNTRAGRSRYQNARPDQEAVPAKECLYGWDYVRGCVIVHEGPVDVWRTGPGGVALMGLTWSAAQLSLLASVPRRVVCLDATPQAQAAARRLAAELALCGGQTLNVCLDSKDPGEATSAETAYLREVAESGTP